MLAARVTPLTVTARPSPSTVAPSAAGLDADPTVQMSHQARSIRCAVRPERCAQAVRLVIVTVEEINHRVPETR